MICVSKFHPNEAIIEAYQAGERDFGESRVQELLPKYEALPKDIRWHFIGHLQTNKVKQVVGKVDLIQSVDRLKLLQCIQEEARKQNIIQDILLEINVGEEESKSGFGIVDILPLVEKISDFPNVRLRGLMAIPPICENPGDNDKFFLEIRNLAVDITAKKYDNVSVDILSMGMSGDYADAIACGSTMIRVGTAIFGARNYQNT